MAINIVTSTAGAIYIQTGIGVPTHVAPKGSQFTDTASGKLYRNLDGQTDWQEQISFTGASESVSAFTIFNTTTPGQNNIVADTFNDTITFSGVNMSILTNDVTKTMTFSGSSDGSFLTNIPISGVNGLQTELDNLDDADIATFDFNQSASTITIGLNGGGTFPIDVTSLAQGIFIVSGEYDPNSGSIEFTNSTGGTFVVTGFTTGLTDTFVDSGTFNDTTYEVDFTKNMGLGFSVDLSEINNDITATTLSLQTQIDAKADEVDFNTHTADTSIHYTKSSILLSELGDSGHTHPISEVNGLQSELDSKTDLTLFNSHTANTSNPHQTTFADLTSTAHTHTISDVTGLQDELDTLASGSASSGLTADFNAHTADTSIHYTKSSILLSELGDSAHTHTIAEVNGLDANLMGLNDGITGNTANIISGVTFNNSTYILSLNKNNDTSFSANLSALASDVYVLSGTYDPNTGNVEFTNSTGGTFLVTGFTTGMTDTFVDSGTFNGTTYEVDFTKNIGLGFALDLSEINDDITGATLNLQTQIDAKADEVDFNTHTADTSIHYTKSSILLSELGDSGHTHPISEVNGLQSELDALSSGSSGLTADFNAHTADTSIHYTKSSILLSELGDSAHTHTIAEINGLQSELDSKADEVDFNTHTADTSIHYTKSSILLSELGDSAHTHTIAEVNGLQDELDALSSGSSGLTADFNAHTADTSIHYTKSSILLSELGDSAHTHTIMEIDGLGSNLMGLNDGITGNTANIISGVTFDEGSSILSLNKNDDTSFIANLSALASDVYVVSGSYNPQNEEITFTNNTGGTFIVTGVTTGTTDTFIDSGVINPTTYEVDFTKNIGLGFALDLSTIQNDIITGDTALQTQIDNHVSDGNNPHSTTFSNLVSTAHTHTISDVFGLQGELNSKLDLTGGTLTGSLSATTYFGDGSNLTNLEFAGINVGSGATIMDISDTQQPKFKTLVSTDNTVIINEGGTEINLRVDIEPQSGTSAEFIAFIGRNSTSVTGITASPVQLPFDTTDSNKPEVFTYSSDALTINRAGTYQLDVSTNLIGDVNNNRSEYEVYYTINDSEPAGARSKIYGRQNNFGGEATVISLLTNVMSGDTIKVFAQRVVGGGTGEIPVAGTRVRLMKFDNLLVDSVDWNNILNRPDLTVAVGDLLGEWDASTNTPTITSGSHTGNTGDFYIVNVSGTTNIDGNALWNVNDWIVWSESQFQWLKIDNQSGVLSINGFQGVVNLDSDDIPEGFTNLYMTTSEKSKLAGIENGAQVNVRGDLSQTNSGATDFVLNKLAEHITYDNSSTPLSSTDVQGAITELSNEKLDLTGGTLTGSLSATTYFGDGSNLTGISGLVTGFTYDDSNNITLERSENTPLSVNITQMSGVTVNGLISGSSISINGGEVMTRIADSGDFRLLANGASTGVIEYNGLSSNINDDANFDLGAVKGWIVDNTTDPETPTQTYINFPGSTVTNPSGVTLDFLATHLVTYIGLTGDTVADIVQSNMPFTESESRDILNLGVVVHSNNTNINAINNKPKLLIDDTLQTYDLMTGLGPFNLGNSDGNNLFSANGANLSIDKTEGRIFSFGSNYITDSKNPHIITLAGLTAPTFRYRLQDSTEFSDTTVIDPDMYDVGGVLTPVPTNKFTIQRINLFVSNIVRLQYGQTYYDNLDDAESSIQTESFVIEQNIKENGLLRGFLIVKEGTTDLTNPTEARFVNAPQFGHASETAIGNVHRTQILNNGSTGLRTGGVISISGLDTINISAGSGQIINNFSDPMDPEFVDVVWDDITGTTISALTASVFTFIAIDENRNVIQYPGTTPPTSEDKRDNIFLGAVSHAFGFSLEQAINAPIPITSPINQMEDLANAIGPFSIRGNVISPIAGTLQLQKSNGTSFFYGRNFQTNKKNPSVLNTPLISGATITYASGQNFIINATNTIDVDNYDPDGAGSIVAVPNNDFVAHRVWHLPGNNSLIFQYGQESYSTFNIVLERFTSENFVVPPGLEEGGYLVAIIIVQEGETDLTAGEVRIIPQGKFAGGGGGGGGGGTADTLQSAYNNGVSPEIITDGTRAAVDFRTGIGLDSTNLVTFQQNNGTINGYVTGLGDSSFNSVLSSSVSATTLAGDGSAITNLTIPPLQQRIKVAKSGATYSTIQSAIDSITDASLSNQYGIEVCPGVYTEDVVMKPYITIDGKGLATIVRPTDPDNTIFDFSGAFHSSVNNLSVSGATGSGGTAFNVDTLLPGDGVSIDGITFYSNNKFVNVNNPTGATSTISVRNSIIPPSTVFSVGFDIGGDGVSAIDISGLRGSLNPSNTGLLVRGSGPNNLISLSSVGLISLGTPDGIELSDGVTFLTQAVSLDGFDKGLTITDSGDGPELNVNDLILTDNSGLAIDIQNQNTTGSLGGSWSFDNIDIVSDTNISMVFTDPTNNNVAVSVLGDVYQADSTERILNLSKLVRQSATLGLISGGTLSDGGGLDLDVSAGNGFLYNTTIGEVLEANWTADTITLTDNTKNFIFINENLVPGSALSRPAFGTVVFLGIANTLNGGIEFIERNELNSLIHGDKVEEYLRHVLGVRYVSGSLVTEGTTDRTLDIGSGRYNFGTTEVNPTGGTPVNFTQYYRDGGSSWTTTATTLVNNTHFDDGSGTLSALTAGYYAKHALYTVGEGADEQYMLVLGQQQFSAATTAFGAELGPLPIKPNIFDGTNTPLIASIIVREGDSNIFQIDDLRPISVSGPQGTTGGSGGGGVTFHGDLSGLLNDDHTQYLLATGARAMSGDLDMGTNNVTNVGTVDGVDVSAHASRHLPNGADALTTGVPSTVGTSNSEGVANAFSRQDHIHAHGNQGGGALHAAATTSVNGFMSAADKTLNDNLFTNGILNNDLIVDNITTGTINAPNINTGDLSVSGDVTGNLSITGNVDIGGTVFADVYDSNTTAVYHGDGSNLTGVIKNGENVGTGHGVFTGTSGTDLQFRSLVAGSNITITPSTTEITIASTGGGSSRIESSVQTTNAVATELEKINTLTDNATNIVEVYVKAYQTGSGAVWGVWKRTLTVTKISGTVNIREINADVDKTSAGLTATSIAFNINGGDIDLDVTGIAATTIEWDSAYEIIL